MHLFSRLAAVTAITLIGILIWDLNQERLEYPGRKVIIYASMFGPGEPMQVLYGGPAPATASRTPLGPGNRANFVALADAWPGHRGRIGAAWRTCAGRNWPADATPDAQLVADYRELAPGYVDKLVAALNDADRGNRLRLFDAFAQAHPQFDRRMILQFERLHPAWTVGLFEDFERRHPDYKVVPRWDSRWVLSANRPRFLTGTDVPDLITGSLAELRILYRENLAMPLDQPLPDAPVAAWRSQGILRGEKSYFDPSRTLADEFQPWALRQSLYRVAPEDVAESGNPFPAGTDVLYMLPRMVSTTVVFANKAHFRKVGLPFPPRTIAEFEEDCRKLRAAGIEPIANDGMDYTPYWWQWMVYREIGYEAFMATAMNMPGAKRFAGPGADPRYLEIARRLRGWRDRENFWMRDFSSSQWPAAQRRFGSGDCTFLFTGTWLPAEIAGTRSWDPDVMDLGCFVFPDMTGGSGRPGRMDVGTQGYVLCRQGRDPEGAVLLLRYLTAEAGELFARKLNYIPVTQGTPFPRVLADIEPAFSRAGPEDFVGLGVSWYAPRFNKFVLTETYNRFFVVLKDNLTPEQFVEELERRAQEHYARNGGTAK
ncbi:MAG: hypothetical protein BIFFINMI_00080 [Phycisphaerae bacterium]|nr:hypothetical protein [Phycisphaerae bacterium]